MNRRRVTVSPSNAPGMPRSSGVLRLVLVALCGTGPAHTVRGANQGVAGALAGACAHRLDRLGRPARTSALACSWRSLVPQPTARAPARHTARRRLRVAGALRERAQRDRVGELAHGRECRRAPPAARARSRTAGRRRAARGRVLPRAHDARIAVVQQVALVDRLDEQLVLLASAGRARPAAASAAGGRRSPAARRPRGATSVAIRPPSPRSSARELRAVRARSTRPARHQRGSPARAGTRTRRQPPRPCARSARASCASDGNHASNCDGGG